MIYLKEEFMEAEKLFREGAFTKRGNAFYYVVEEEKEDLYLCVKLFNQSPDGQFEMEVVSVSVDFSNKEEIEHEAEVGMMKDITFALDRLFSSLRNIESVEYLKFGKGILELVNEYFNDDAFYYSENNKVFVEILDIFEFTGEVVEGFYSNSLKLANIELENRMTKQVIAKFEDVAIEGMIDYEENEDISYLLEVYAESLLPSEIEGLIKQTVN